MVVISILDKAEMHRFLPATFFIKILLHISIHLLLLNACLSELTLLSSLIVNNILDARGCFRFLAYLVQVVFLAGGASPIWFLFLQVGVSCLSQGYFGFGYCG